MKEKFSIFILAIFLLSLLSPLIGGDITYAKDKPEKTTKIEQLASDEERLSPTTKVKHNRNLGWQEVKDAGFPKEVWEAVRDGRKTVEQSTLTISTVPTTMPDLETLIVCEWIPGEEPGGIPTFETGNNLYYSKVTGTRVFVDYEGKAVAWAPAIYAGTNRLELIDGPRLIDDKYNPSEYPGNTIGWAYRVSIGGFLSIGSRTITVERYLRQREGTLKEYYVITEDPGVDIRIVTNLQEEEGFEGFGPAFAYDANYKPIELGGDKYGRIEKILLEEQLARPDIEYPVTIDPPFPFSTSSYDAYLGYSSLVYYTTKAAPSAQLVAQYSFLGIDNSYAAGVYQILRSVVFFDTEFEDPEMYEVDSGYLELYGSTDASDTDFYVVIQEGMPTYPHLPPIASDYNYANYGTTDGGSLYTGSYSAYGWNKINLNSQGISWINLAGWTKFMLRNSHDISGTIPTEYEYVDFKSSESGSSYAPRLILEITQVVSSPIIDTRTADNEEETTAILRGRIISDGGAACSGRFKIGTDTSYTMTPTSWVGGLVDGSTWESSSPPLSPGILYHYTAEATHGEDPSSPNDQTFLTKPESPYSFTPTPGNTQVALTWNRGDGADNTVVVMKVGGYPTSITDGTVIYFDTGTSYTKTGLTNGEEYFFKAWSEITSGGWQQYSDAAASTTGTPYASGASIVVTEDEIGGTNTEFVANGYLQSLSGYGSADCYFEWYKEGDAAWGHSTIATKDVLTATGYFDETITGLDASTTYFFRAVSDNTDPLDPSYGASETVVTGQVSAPTMDTMSDTARTAVSTIIWGRILDDGGAPCTVWFEWGPTLTLGTLSETIWTGVTDEHESVSYPLSGLTPNTIYYYTIVGENAVPGGVGNKEILNFTTETPDAPSIVPEAASDVGATTALLNTLLTDDGETLCQIQFQISPSGNFTGEEVSSGWTSGFTSGQRHSWLASNLTIEQTYSFRAQARNVGGTTNSTVLTFTTVFGAPGDFLAIPLSKSSISISWTNQGEQIKIMGKTGTYPSDRLNGELVYFGPANSFTWGNLNSGTTYYIRAWSWREGEIFSNDYSQSVASTTGSIQIGTTEYPTPVDPFPGAPAGFYRTPSGENLQDLPITPIIDHIADGTGWPVGTVWFITAILSAVALGLFALVVSQGSILWALIVGTVVLFVWSEMGPVPGAIVWITAGFTGFWGLILRRGG